ncbi:hypothetical protein DDW05_02565 [Candidatus Nanobsidianus stetteri]|uniref:Uncharacterized protein n=1 Tax=Nanobsidianus stetteri TaxID=1294122 RepID=A0A2T9WS05_NANST|nr:hypothetical protein DDW05_02565 [Candidatus Nanobsidianus stetteri]
MSGPKKYIKDLVYNVKKVLPLKDDLDKIIEREHEKAFEILHKFGIIEYMESKYKNYKKPKLKIVEDEHFFKAKYSPTKNKIVFSKGTIKSETDRQYFFIKYFSYKEDVERLIDNPLKDLGYKEIKDIEYLNNSLDSKILLCPFYINDKNIMKSIAEAIILSTMFHEIWHSFDFSILDKLEKDPTIKDRDYLLTILKDHDNLELRASAFQVVMYYLANGFHNDERGYMAAYFNIPKCREYIEEINMLENYGYKDVGNPYDLGRYYGNIIVAKYRSSLEEYIYKIIDDIIHLDKKRAIDKIKHYVYNPDKLLHDKNS